MNVIFLDMDGVLCTNRSHLAYGGKGVMAHLDPVAVKMVETLCHAGSAEIVLSSTWREFFELNAMERILQNAGFSNVPWHQCWKTPSMMGLQSRGSEIRLWFQQHGGKVKRYVILDDQTDFLAEQRPHLIQTDVRDGFLYGHYLKALEILTHGPVREKVVDFRPKSVTVGEPYESTPATDLVS